MLNNVFAFCSSYWDDQSIPDHHMIILLLTGVQMRPKLTIDHDSLQIEGQAKFYSSDQVSIKELQLIFLHKYNDHEKNKFTVITRLYPFVIGCWHNFNHLHGSSRKTENGHRPSREPRCLK